MKKISISIPCYNEEDNVLITYMKLTQIMRGIKKYDYELIFIDNGSLDKTKDLIKKITSKDKKVKGILLSRNFGPEASGHAGLVNVSGDAFIGIGCDLQDPPELITKLIKKWEEGYEVVLGKYSKTEDSKFMTFMRRSFYNVFKKIASIDIPTNVSGFGIYDKKVIESLKSLPEKYRFSRGLTAWVGFKTTYINYERKSRLHGKSSYNFFRYIRDSERGIFGFSYLPLDLIVYIGLVITLLSFLFITGYLFTVFVFGNPINASIPIMLAVVFFGGLNLMALSIIGKYIQVIVEETKNRPVYIIDKKINF